MTGTLICITSCNRLAEVKKYILPYIQFVNENENFNFLLSLDGTNEDYIKFCKKFEIPLIYSDEREGVGMSKNRVLSQFPNFDHYFFIDDDVELYNSKIFDIHVKFGDYSVQFYHMSSTPLKTIEHSEYLEGHKLLYSHIGGGYFNYFHKNGIKTVGGWHSKFAKYKRYGHTEHSYRFKNAGLSSYPFTVISECINDLILHDPVHVTNPITNGELTENELFIEEQILINEKLKYFPVQTISAFYFNGFDLNYNNEVSTFLKKNKKKYPLIKGTERLKCFSSYYFFKHRIETSLFFKMWYFCIAALFNPLNPEIKHSVKTKFKH